MNAQLFSLTTLLTLLLAGAFLAFLVISAVLVYHWRRYGMKAGAVHLAEAVYFLVSACIVALSVFFYFMLV